MVGSFLGLGGNVVIAFVLIVSQAGKEKRVVDELMRLPFVREASLVFGDYDIVAKVEVDNPDMLSKILLEQIRQISSVSMTTTLISV